MIRGFFRWALTLTFLAILGSAGLIGWRFLQFTQKKIAFETPHTITINSGASMVKIAQVLQAPPIGGESWQWILLAKIKRADRSIKAGDYVLSGTLTVTDIIDKMVRGDVLLQGVRIPEGKTIAEILALLEKNTLLINDIKGLSMQALAEKINAPVSNLEGWLYPDTYRLLRGTKMSEVISMAYLAMQKKIQNAWQNRRADSPLQNIYEALILASIVEKESGRADDRGLIASVFINRLKANMPMQSDPTVIYGLGEQFNGNLTRAHLLAPTPYNTYTIARLPPTPIASVSESSLQAVVNPPESSYYYFVARGDGSSAFSRTLSEHNMAVNTYQRSGSKR